LVDTIASNPDPTPIDTTKQDAKALFFIQQAVHDTVFVKIAAEKAAKEAWIILKTTFSEKFQGSCHQVAGLETGV
jgi:hypothetical protein